MYIKNLILGAGISGISAASALDKENTIVFEKENYYGGLCNSFEIDGFRFDTAIHLSFANEKQVRDVFDKTKYYTHIPLAYNYVNGVWLKHPVQNNLFKLKKDEKISCIKSFIEKPEFKDITNYEQWLLATYGEYICDKFHNKYTEKYWCKYPKELSINWIGNRLNIPKIEKILEGAFDEKTGIDYYTKEMRYPKKGGYKAFLEPMIDNIDIELNKEAKKIDLEKKIVYFDDGSKYEYKNLISSIPLPKLINIIKDVPNSVKKASENLIATSIVLASVGFDKENIAPYLWFYVYDEDILPARVYSPSLKSKDNVPSGCSSLQFEIYYTKEKPLKIKKQDIKKHIEDILVKMNLCKKEDIALIDIRTIEYGNVIFYKGMEADRERVKKYLKDKGIYSIGRFGEWDYLWSDQSFMSGKQIGQLIKDKG